MGNRFTATLMSAFCKCDGDNMNEVCPTCIVRKECEEFFAPIVQALEERYK